eukprot:jgi/Tetstr1/433248/TSEL_022536.t1
MTGGEKEGKVDPWKLWHYARTAPETWVGKKQRQMKRKALFAALLELRRAFVAGAEKAGELAPRFWSWAVIALLFTPAHAPAQITHIDGQAPNLQAIFACTCHCRPTEVYRGPEVSFRDAVKHILYPGHEDHRLTERTLAETDPGAADLIISHKNLMQPLEDLERGMGVPEEDKPYLKQYHGNRTATAPHVKQHLAVPAPPMSRATSSQHPATTASATADGAVAGGDALPGDDDAPDAPRQEAEEAVVEATDRAEGVVEASEAALAPPAPQPPAGHADLLVAMFTGALRAVAGGGHMHYHVRVLAGRPSCVYCGQRTEWECC